MARRPRQPTEVLTITHSDEARRNIPTAELEPVMDEAERKAIHLAYERRNRDLDPQLVWRGKDEQDLLDLIVPAPPLFIQEKVHPKVLVDDLVRVSRDSDRDEERQIDLFADFNGLTDPDARAEFYQHDQNWTNRMILGDSLQVMASLAEREGLRGKVQCIYIDPPYGIRFNSNFQWSTTSRDVRDGNPRHITREPEQVKAYRDTWRDGIHSYLSYLRDRLTAARDLLADSGSVFVQIGDENVHRVRAIMDEVLGEENFVNLISFVKTGGKGGSLLDTVNDFVLWYAKDRTVAKYRQLHFPKVFGGERTASYVWIESPDGQSRRRLTSKERSQRDIPARWKLFSAQNMTSQSGGDRSRFPVTYQDSTFIPAKNFWKTNPQGMHNLIRANRLIVSGKNLNYVRYQEDSPIIPIHNIWSDTAIAGFSGEDKTYVVQTARRVIQRCILMATDPGDLVLDPTCGAGTTAYVAEQWGRRWITIDTSRVALALARARVMGARYPYYMLSDSAEGQRKRAEIERREPSTSPTYGNVRQGFVYERVPHITLRDIANNAEIDIIWDEFQRKLEPLRERLNAALGESWEEWEIPREAGEDWAAAAKKAHADWWKSRIARQKEIDASIAAKAEFEYLYDKPYEARGKVRVAGPFTVESLSPHRVVGAEYAYSEIEEAGAGRPYEGEIPPERDFGALILDNLTTSGIQQSQKADRIEFTQVKAWPGEYICAEGRFMEGDTERRAGIFIGPEFGTVTRPDLTRAAREAAEAGYEMLIACAFSYDAQSADLTRIGALPVLKARMNADLHMADTLKNDSRGNLFVIFGEPDIEVQDAGDDMIWVKIHGVDIYHPATGQVRSDDTDGIACWFVDSDYNEESFFVKQAYFLGANDPYKALKTTLRSEINSEAWATLNSDISRPFPRPKSGRIAVKVINHLGDEAMKVISV